jgi:hypothetical protein
MLLSWLFPFITKIVPVIYYTLDPCVISLDTPFKYSVYDTHQWLLEVFLHR